MKYRTVRFFASPLIKMLWPTTFYGTENLILDSRAIYTCNHYSAMDTNCMVAKLFVRDFNVVIKEEAFKSKFGAKFLTGIGGIPIKRGDADMDAVKKILAVLKEDKQLLLFPEGTRNKAGTKELLEIKPGAVMFAIKTHSPIIPMIQYHSPKLFRRNYIIVGKPIYFDQFYGQKINSIIDDATQILIDNMNALRIQLDDIVENYKGNIKKFNSSNTLKLEKK